MGSVPPLALLVVLGDLVQYGQHVLLLPLLLNIHLPFINNNYLNMSYQQNCHCQPVHCGCAVQDQSDACLEHIEMIRDLLAQKKDQAKQIDALRLQHKNNLLQAREEHNHNAAKLVKDKLHHSQQEFEKEKLRLFGIIKEKESTIKTMNKEAQAREKQVQGRLNDYDNVVNQRDKWKKRAEDTKIAAIDGYKQVYKKYQEGLKHTQYGILQTMKYSLNTRINQFMRTFQNYCQNQIRVKNNLREVHRHRDRKAKALIQSAEQHIKQAQIDKDNIKVTLEDIMSRDKQHYQDKLTIQEQMVARLQRDAAQHHSEIQTLQAQLKEAQEHKQVVEVIKEVPVDRPVLQTPPPRDDCDPLVCEVQRLRCQLQKCEEVQLENSQLRNALDKAKKDTKLLGEEVRRLEAKNQKKSDKMDQMEDQLMALQQQPHEEQVRRQMQFHIDFLTEENQKLHGQLLQYKAFVSRLAEQAQGKSSALADNLAEMDDLLRRQLLDHITPLPSESQAPPEVDDPYTNRHIQAAHLRARSRKG